MARCNAKTKSNHRCKRSSCSDSEYCSTHKNCVKPETENEPITWTQEEMNDFAKTYYGYFREMNMYDDMEEQLIEYKKLGKTKFENRPCMKGFRLNRWYY